MALAVSSEAGFHQAVLHVQALGGQEGIRHAAADDELVAFGEQGFHNQDLVADLCAAENGNIGMFRIGDGAPKIFQFLFHQETGDSRQEVRHAFGGGMGAVRRTKCIVDVHITQRGHLVWPVPDRSFLRLYGSGYFPASALRRA